MAGNSQSTAQLDTEQNEESLCTAERRPRSQGNAVDPGAAPVHPHGKEPLPSQSSESVIQGVPGSSKDWAGETGGAFVLGMHRGDCWSRTGRSDKTRHPQSNQWKRRIGPGVARGALRQDWDLAVLKSAQH